MYGSNTRGFAAAVITGGLIGVSGTAAGMRAVPLSPTPPEHREPGALDGRHNSESAVNRIAAAEFGEVGVRSMQVDFDQQAPRALGDRPPFTTRTSAALGDPGGQSWAGGAGVQPGFPTAAGPRQPSMRAQQPGAQFGGQPQSRPGSGAQQFGGQLDSAGQLGQSRVSDAQRLGAQQFGAPLGSRQPGPSQSNLSQSASSQSASWQSESPRSGSAPLRAGQSSGQQSYLGASATVALSAQPANSATVALSAQRPVPAGPLGPGGAPASSYGPSSQSGAGGFGAGQPASPLDRTYQLPAAERGPHSDYAADLMGGPVRFVEPAGFDAQGSGGLRAVSDSGGHRPAMDGTKSRTGSHHAGAGGHRTVADLVAATDSYRPVAGSGRRRARPENLGGLRVVPDVSEQPDHVGVPDVPGSSGYRPAADLSGTGDYRPVSGAGSSGGRRRAVPDSVGTSMGTGDHRGVTGTGGYRPVAGGPPRTGFDAYGQAAPEVELGQLDARPQRSGMFIDRAVESSLPTTAVLSQRLTADGTGGHRAVKPAREVGEQHLAEPRYPRHDIVDPISQAERPEAAGWPGLPGHGSEGRTSALGSLDSSGLFGSLSSRER